MSGNKLKNSKRIFSQDGFTASTNTRISNLENNEYKVTYYEIVSGTSGTLTTPTNSTINADEFGLSGNAILSKIDGFNKPTYESPKTVGGIVVTANLTTTTGAWIASDIYTDTSVALIYSIKISALYYSNLNYDRIIETISMGGTSSSGVQSVTGIGVNNTDPLNPIVNIPTKTSDLTNDGDNGVSHFITLEDLPSNLTLYATNVASDIGGYFKLVTAITDPSYNTAAVNIPTGPIITTNQFIASLATSANVIVGNPGIFNVTTIGNIQKLSGTGNAEFYFEVWKRTLAGTETLITTSAYTLPVLNSGYAEFSASALWNDGTFLETDRIVLKYYATRIVTGSDPSYQFQFGGLSPVRTLVPIPLNVTTTVNVNSIGSAINNAASATPNDIDLVMSVDTSVAKKNTWIQIKAFLKTYFDSIYTTTSAVASQITTALTGYELISNKSNSYTVSSSTTYASTKALVDGLASVSVTPNVQTVASAATVTPTFTNDEVAITAQAIALFLANPTGTPVDGKSLVIRIKDNGTAQAITYDTQYRAIGVTLPTSTVINKTLYLGLIYNATDTKWDVIGVAQQA